MSTNHRKLSRIACIIAVIMLFISCPHSNYENVRLDKKSDGLIFHPDQNAPREPMPLNISAFIAHSCGRWGVLFNVPYRETGLRAINRTIFTSGLYLAVVDEGLNTYTRKPILTHKKEGHCAFDFAGTDDGFAVSYIAGDNRLILLSQNAPVRKMSVA